MAGCAGAALLVGAGSARAQTTEDLRRLSLEQLMNLPVTTAARTPTPQAQTPAAVSVITQDDLRRAGVTSLVEALRLVPGVQVAQIDSSRWAVGIRGFADRLSRSVLVLIDGRAVYSPLFAGTYWEVQDTLIDDIDRIEVIRGPGGTLWGANAVNGIINIITKDSAETQGAFAKLSAGSLDRAAAALRFGGRHGSNLHYRVYGKAFDRAAEFHPDGNRFDDWRMGQGGFRADATFAGDRKLTVQGDAYGSSDGQHATLNTFDPPVATPIDGDAHLRGANLLGRWGAHRANGTGLQLQAFFDWTRREELTFQESRRTFDLDFQHTVRPLSWQRLVWGLGYQVTSSDTSSPPTTLAFEPPQRTDTIASAFVQDEAVLAGDRLRLTAGSKFEHNDYSGFEVQPSASLVWTPSEAQTVVVSATRAVRTPSRVERDLSLYSYNSQVNLFLHLLPNPDFDSEKLASYELEYRTRPMRRLFVTSSIVLNHHTDLLSTEVLPVRTETGPPPAHTVLPLFFGNGLHGESHGIELTADLRPASIWRVTSSYSYLRIALSREPGSVDVSQERRGEGGAPRHQVQVQSSLDLPHRVGLEWMFRAVSALSAFGVPRYATSDVNLIWSPAPRLELSLVGRNLHHAHHLEFENGAGIERTVLVRAAVYW